MFSDLRIASMAPKTLLGTVLRIVGPVLDKLLGVHHLREMYQSQALQGLDKQIFSQRLLQALGVQVIDENNLTDKIPKTGRCIVVCNHPYGMIEGVIIAQLLTSYRNDTKIMANVGLKAFKEISDYFIFANPLNPRAAINTSAIKQCFNHVKNEGLLVIFPAGRVSFYQSEKQRISDGQWNRLAVQIAEKTKTPILPVFISGTNSRLFHRLGRVYYRFRLMMLVREMLKLDGKKIGLKASNIIEQKQLNEFVGIEKMNDFVRLACYLNDDKFLSIWPEDEIKEEFQTVITATDKTQMQQELAKLPSEQRLVNFKSFTVYYGYQQQIPQCVREITRLREITFRTLNEGSGEERDTDKFDETYMHLFIYDHKNNEIIGAYRIGQTDLLQKNKDTSALYLSQMFAFEPEFINQQQPCLEMGRSFIVEAHQNSFYGLLLLWKGIGAFVAKNPRYRTLYGTVSLSKLYDPRSVALINKVMVSNESDVSAKLPFVGLLHPEVEQFVDSSDVTITQLSAFITAIESDGKDIPVLLKQYHKLGAKFHCMGVDQNFNQTPGLLLSVNLPQAPDKLLKLYLGDKRADYIAFER